MGSLILIFSIHFSPFLRRILSHPYAVFLGSISFPFYLIHAILIRSLLVWVIYGILPLSPPAVGRVFSGDRLSATHISAIWAVVYFLVFGSWLVLTMYLSTLWRDRLDGHCVAFAMWVEEAVAGKKPFGNPLRPVMYRFMKSGQRGEAELPK